MSGQLGSLVISLTADMARFSSDMGKANKIAQDNAKSISSHFDAIGSAASKAAGFIAGLGGAAALGALVKNSINAADELSKMSQKVGVNISQLSGMAYAAGLADVSTEQLSKGMGKLNKAMYEASNGGKTQVDTFKALGVSVTDSTGQLRKSDAVMMDIAERFSKMEDGAAKTALAMKVFGKSGADMIPLLNGGREEMRKNTEEARRFGNVLTEEAGRQAEEFNDNLTRLNAVSGGLARALVIEIVPAVNELAAAMLSLVNVDSGSWVKQQLRDWHDFHSGVDQIIRDIAIKAGSGNGVWNWLTKGGRAEIQAELQASQQLYEHQMESNAAQFGNSVKAKAPLKIKKDEFETPTGAGKTGKAYDANAAWFEMMKNEMGINEAFAQARISYAAAEKKLTDEAIKAADEASAAWFKMAEEQMGQMEALDQARASYGVKDLVAEGQKLSDRYQEILMYQKELYDSSPWLGMEQGLKDYIKEVGPLGEAFEDLAFNSMQTAEDAFVDFVHTGKLSFSELADSIIADLIRIQVQQTITKPLAGLLGEGLSLFSGMLGSSGYTGGLDRAAATSTYDGAFDVPQYALGTNYVPKDGLAYLHEGEAVIPTEFNKPGAGDMSVSVGPINVTSGAIASELRTEIESTVVKVMRRHS